MIAILSVLVVISLSILVTRVATVALTLTGLSRESARFQARSAFTGVGFTTGEAERVVSHPVRRRIVMWLMLVGNAGIVTVVGSLVLGFVNANEAGANRLLRTSVLIGGVAALWVLSRSKLVDSWLSPVIARALKRFTRLDVGDYAGLLHLTGGYRVRQLRVRPGDWCADRTLEELALREEGVVVLGIDRVDGAYIPAPLGATRILPRDQLILYGEHALLENLDTRRVGPEGERDHAHFVERQKRLLARQRRYEERTEHFVHA